VSSTKWWIRHAGARRRRKHSAVGAWRRGRVAPPGGRGRIHVLNGRRPSGYWRPLRGRSPNRIESGRFIS
jgi:hypothetical protein